MIDNKQKLRLAPYEQLPPGLHVEHLGLDAVLYERHRSYDGNHHVAVGRGDPTVGGHPRSFRHGADIGVRVVLLRRVKLRLKKC